MRKIGRCKCYIVKLCCVCKQNVRKLDCAKGRTILLSWTLIFRPNPFRNSITYYHLPSSRASSNGGPIVIFAKYGHFKATGIKTTATTTTAMMTASTTVTNMELSENIETLNSAICKNFASKNIERCVIDVLERLMSLEGKRAKMCHQLFSINDFFLRCEFLSEKLLLW